MAKRKAKRKSKPRDPAWMSRKLGVYETALRVGKSVRRNINTLLRNVEKLSTIASETGSRERIYRAHRLIARILKNYSEAMTDWAARLEDTQRLNRVLEKRIEKLEAQK